MVSPKREDSPDRRSRGVSVSLRDDVWIGEPRNSTRCGMWSINLTPRQPRTVSTRALEEVGALVKVEKYAVLLRAGFS